jgi:3'-phosphoadenosine 5'-phosphosulfate sulfotransferase (PAPS reductase)/FAD synthetase
MSEHEKEASKLVAYLSVERAREHLELREKSAIARIDKALSENPKIKGLWALYSGGHDSLVSTYVASLHPLFKGVIHVNTKTSPSAELVTRYARSVAKSYGWRFIEISPFITHTQLFVKYGFPSPDAHEFVYQYLKGRPLKQARQIAKAALLDEMLGEKTIEFEQPLQPDEEGRLSFIKDDSKARAALSKKVDIAFVSGIRREESVKRSKKPEYGMDSGILWINSIVDWTKVECSDYINIKGLRRNVMADQTGVSGECDCGAHAAAGEIDFKCAVNADMAAYRAKLEELVRVARELQLMEVQFGMRSPDTVIDEHDTVWGHGRRQKNAPKVPDEQMSLFHICSDCEGERDERVLRMMCEYPAKKNDKDGKE